MIGSKWTLSRSAFAHDIAAELPHGTQTRYCAPKMDVLAFLPQSRVLFITGKGGVGKTTISAALAVLASQEGRNVLLVEVEGKPDLSQTLGVGISTGYEEVELLAPTAHSKRRSSKRRAQNPGASPLEEPAGKGSIRARTLTADEALIEYMNEHNMRGISRRLISSGALDVVSTAIPGIRDILLLGKLKQIERSGTNDLIIVDTPASGHAMTFLSSGQGLLDAARSGPIRAQAAEVVEMLTDPARSQVMLVTVPEETPVREAAATAFSLEDRVGVTLGPIFVNNIYPQLAYLDVDPAAAAAEAGASISARRAAALGAAAHFRLERQLHQLAQLERLTESLPLPQVRIPHLFTETGAIGPSELEVIAQHLHAGISSIEDLQEPQVRPGAGSAVNRSHVDAGKLTRVADPQHAPPSEHHASELSSRQDKASEPSKEPAGVSSKPVMYPIARLLAEKTVIICCGAGGVGKTTTAAALAIAAARRGLRTCVVTIDPARRLADALGLGELENEPSRIDGNWSGELWAMMLDVKRTFDDLVREHAPDPSRAERILSNRIYNNLTATLSGTQEYMAMEKLHALQEKGGFDLIVVDTPPTRNALEFLNAPARLARFLNNRLFRILLWPGRAYVKTMTAAAKAFLGTLSKVAGSDVVGDAIAFFEAFEGMEEGFRVRAEAVHKLLHHSETAFAVIATPSVATLQEASYFASKLKDAHMSMDAMIVNRVSPVFDGETMEGREAQSHQHNKRSSSPPSGAAFRNLVENLQQLSLLADQERRLLAQVESEITPIPVVPIPMLPSDIHDLDGLGVIANHLVGSTDA